MTRSSVFPKLVYSCFSIAELLIFLRHLRGNCSRRREDILLLQTPFPALRISPDILTRLQMAKLCARESNTASHPNIVKIFGKTVPKGIEPNRRYKIERPQDRAL